MDPAQIGVFDLAERRLAWLDKRQAVLAQNIANANTPHYRPHDLPPFAAALGRMRAVAPLRTQPNHLAGSAQSSQAEVLQGTHTSAPDGNAVALDEQLVKVANTQTTSALVVNIYKKYLGLFTIALGRGT